MLIAEDLLLLVTDDESGRLAAPAEQVDLGLGGADLLELTLMNRVDLAGEGDEVKAGRLVVRDASATGDEVLDAALATVAAHRGKRPSVVLGPLAKHLRRTLYERLAASGVVRAEESTVLGIFPSHRWPAQDASHEQEVRRQLVRALVEAGSPDPRTAALVSLLHALGCEHKVIDPRGHGLTKRSLRERAGEIAEGDWASEAVHTAISQMQAAVFAAVAASTSAVVLPGASG